MNIWFSEEKELEATSCEKRKSTLLDQIWAITTDRLFLIDPLTIGHINKGRMEISIFSVDPTNNLMTLIYKKHFFINVPFDACSHESNQIFVVFPDQNKIVKYKMYREQNFKIMLEENFILDDSFAPQTISCSKGLFKFERSHL
jgi:hypothetical protein